MESYAPHAAASNAPVNANVPDAPSHSAAVDDNTPDAASSSAESSIESEADERQCRAQHMLAMQTSDRVLVVVGQEQCPFLVARELLQWCSARFAEQCANHNVIELPETKVNVFSLFFLWLYNFDQPVDVREEKPKTIYQLALFADAWSIRPLYNQLTAYIWAHNDLPPRSIADQVFGPDELAPHLSILICHQVLRERCKDKFLQVVNESDQDVEGGQEDERSEARDIADQLWEDFEEIREFCDCYRDEDPPFHCCMFHDHDDIEDQLHGLDECPFDEMWYRKEWCRKSKFTENECRRIQEVFDKWRPDPASSTESNNQEPIQQPNSSQETLSLPQIWGDGGAAHSPSVPPTLPPIRISLPGHLPLTLPNAQASAPADGADVSSGLGHQTTYNPLISRQPLATLQPSTAGHGHPPDIDPLLHDASRPSVTEAAHNMFRGWTFSGAGSPSTKSSQDRRRRHGDGPGAATETGGNVGTEQPRPKRQRYILPSGSAPTSRALMENSQAPIGPSAQMSISSLINAQPAGTSFAAPGENSQAPIANTAQMSISSLINEQPAGTPSTAHGGNAQVPIATTEQIPISSLINAQPAGTSSAVQGEISQVPVATTGQSNPGDSSNAQPSNVPPPPPPPPAAPMASAPAPPQNEQQAPTHRYNTRRGPRKSYKV